MFMSSEKVYVRGLRDVAACETKISFVDPYGALYYSGYDIDRLIGRVCFEEVVYLLLNGKLPNKKQLEDTKRTLFSEMKIPNNLLRLCSINRGHPMENLRTIMSSLGEYDSDFEDSYRAGNKKLALKLISQVATIVSAIYRVKNNKEIILPKKEYGFAENFLFMFRGKIADKEEIDALDRYLTLHADHGLNASTFAARVTASTMSDIYSAVISAIGTLRGMGFGHRIYIKEDPRSRHLRKISKSLCSRIGKRDLYNKARAIQSVVHKERKIYPNVDFYAALVLNALGVPKEFITPFFASSRIVGWTSHILEQYREAVLIRPTSNYRGAYGTKFVPLDKR